MATSDSIGAAAAPECAANADRGTLNITAELARLLKMTPRELREEYVEVFGESSRSGNKDWLIKRIAWRLQANAEGGLSERARQRAIELANDADLRMKAPRTGSRDEPSSRKRTVPSDARLPMPGSHLIREYKDQTIRVTVLEDGFEYEGRKYASLSAVARIVTGSHWNGYHFFGLKKNGRSR